MNREPSREDRLLEDLERQVREGLLRDVQERLEKLRLTGWGPDHVLRAANLARRVHRPRLTLKWLHPRIRPEAGLETEPASPGEVCEYAVGLHRIGAYREALELLRGPGVDGAPQARLYQAFGHFAQWDYVGGLSFIESYLRHPGLTDPYQRRVGVINQIAALVFLERYAEALSVADPLLEDLRRDRQSLLWANALELRSQIHIGRGDFRSARSELREAGGLLQSFETVEGLFVEKWTAILDALEKNDPGVLQEFRAKALKLGHWETLRDLDFYRLKIAPQEGAFRWLYFGTPYPAYRRRLREEFAARFAVPAEAWVQHGEGADFEVDPLRVGEELGEIPHRILILLLRDFYKPQRVGEIFSEIFPDEYFNPSSSINRVHQNMKRARDWIAELRWPIRLEEREGAYGLRLGERTRIFVREHPLPLTGEGLVLESLRPVFGDREFTAQEVSEKLGASNAKAGRLLKRALASSQIEKTGAGRNTRYRLVPRGC